jgi:hypothetical protein
MEHAYLKDPRVSLIKDFPSNHIVSDPMALRFGKGDPVMCVANNRLEIALANFES